MLIIHKSFPKISNNYFPKIIHFIDILFLPNNSTGNIKKLKNFKTKTVKNSSKTIKDIINNKNNNTHQI